MSRKPDVLQLVEKQTHKSYGVRKGGSERIISPPSICWQCGEHKETNSCGVCADCWDKFSFLRDACKK